MQHAICFVETGCNPVVRNVDTDVLVLMISHLSFMNEINNSTQVFATIGRNSKQIKVYDLIEVVSTIDTPFAKDCYCSSSLPSLVMTQYQVCTTALKLIFGMNYSNSQIFLNCAGGIYRTLESGYGSHF